MSISYGDILWEASPTRKQQSHMGRFAAQVSRVTGRDLRSYPDLQRWSVEEPATFWAALVTYAGVQFAPDSPPLAAATVYVPPPVGQMRGAKWFPDMRLNFAANLFADNATRAAGAKASGESAGTPRIIALAEGGARRSFSDAQLRLAVARCCRGLEQAGVRPGDRVAGVLANVPEAIIAMLATTALGAVWSSCSPDFGSAAVCDRFAQIAPKVIFFTDAYVYNGKYFPCTEQARATLSELARRGVPVAQAVAVSHLAPGQKAPGTDAGGAPSASPLTPWESFLGDAAPPPLSFVARSFSDPLYIMFSSGTTGVPKCIVHGIGGTLVQHKKELLLHSDIGPGSRLLYFTTCGWMMWNWMVSALATGADLVLFEGSVASPDLGVLWRAVSEEAVTDFGTSPKFISACMTAGIKLAAPEFKHAPRSILSTGAPLLPEHYGWVYAQVDQGRGDLHLASISGGTDILSCFMLGTPLLPVRAGEIQYAGLGMDIDAWEGTGHSVRREKGELVCKTPFPSMPLGFWADPEGARYRKAYFSHFEAAPAAAKDANDAGHGAAIDQTPPVPEVWRHGDYIEITDHGGIIVYGRSDATLNPGGVRIGTAELYRQLEGIDGIADAVAVAARHGGDEYIVLCVKLTPNRSLTPELVRTIQQTIRRGLTPRHVPGVVRAVQDIPYTRSGKKVEVAVTQAINGEPVPNMSALANPEAMAEYVALGKELSSTS